MLNGNQSESDDALEDPFTSKEKSPPSHGVELDFWDSPKVPEKQQTKSITLPIRPARPRPEIPASFRSDTDIQLPRRRSKIALARYTARSQKHPDRFIPCRSDSYNVADKYRIGKAAHELTPTEKLLRHSGASEDAFCYHRRNITPMAADFRPQSLSESISSRIRGLTTPWESVARGTNIGAVSTVLGPIDQNNRSDVAIRQVSSGNVWAVGGVVPGGTAVNNGRGQLVRSGTNAQLFRTSFPTEKPKAVDELEKLEARLAEALGLDRTRRIIETSIPRYRVENVPVKSRGKATKTRWNGTAWANEGAVQSEFPDLSSIGEDGLTMFKNVGKLRR